MPEAPEALAAALAEKARDFLRRASGMEPDYSVESLAGVDHALAGLRIGPPEHLASLCAEVGCYFGEVARRALGGAWAGAPTEEPRLWRLTFAAAPLTIHPVGMTAEAIYQEEVAGYDGLLEVPPALRPSLERALDAMGEVTEETYYSLTGRLETCQHLLDVLVAGRQAARRPPAH